MDLAKFGRSGVRRIKRRLTGGRSYYADPQRYWDERHAKSADSLEGVGLYGLGQSGNERDYEAKWTALAPVLQRSLLPGTSLLDAGCGVGYFTAHARDLGFVVEGVDFSPSAVEQARATSPDIAWHVSDLETFAPARTYDGVMTIDVLFHIVDDGTWARTVQNLGRLIRPEGPLIIQDHLVEAATERTGTQHVRWRRLVDYRTLLDGWSLEHQETYVLPAQETTKDLMVFRRVGGGTAAHTSD
jgi:2-polyprenyl-3-methyl-5-hydroxy-6-metoxy-1,4-benzoquinol methylase